MLRCNLSFRSIVIDRYSFLIGFETVKSFSDLNQKLRSLLRAANIFGQKWSHQPVLWAWSPELFCLWFESACIVNTPVAITKPNAALIIHFVAGSIDFLLWSPFRWISIGVSSDVVHSLTEECHSHCWNSSSRGELLNAEMAVTSSRFIRKLPGLCSECWTRLLQHRNAADIPGRASREPDKWLWTWTS